MMDLPTTDTRAEVLELAAEECLRSDQLTEKALDWSIDHAIEHPALVELIVAYYTESPQFGSWVEDVADGEPI